MSATRVCCRPDCDKIFEKPSGWDKKYCSRSCSAKVNNSGRNRHEGRESKVVFEDRVCANRECAGVFTCEIWNRKLYCSRTCYQLSRKNSASISSHVRTYNKDKPCSRCGNGITKDALNCRECNIQISTENRIKSWIDGEWDGSAGPTGLSKTIRRYLLEQANYQCQQCGFDTPHPVDGSTILEIDHINGDGTDHRPENLRVLCPNCHALTPTYRARNTGKGRNVYYLRVSREDVEATYSVSEIATAT